MIEECIPKWAVGFALTSVGVWFLVNSFIFLGGKTNVASPE